MTKPQAEALKKAILFYQDRMQAIANENYQNANSEWVEYGRGIGPDPRTVESLENTGLVETRGHEKGRRVYRIRDFT